VCIGQANVSEPPMTTARAWRIASTRNNQRVEDLAKLIDPVVRGWMNYYGQILAHEVHRSPALHQRGSRPIGETEIQTLAISKNRLHTLAGTARAARPEPLVPVADRYPTVGWKIEAG
jgi:hypothetical protein